MQLLAWVQSDDLRAWLHDSRTADLVRTARQIRYYTSALVKTLSADQVGRPLGDLDLETPWQALRQERGWGDQTAAAGKSRVRKALLGLSVWSAVAAAATDGVTGSAMPVLHLVPSAAGDVRRFYVSFLDGSFALLDFPLDVTVAQIAQMGRVLVGLALDSEE